MSITWNTGLAAERARHNLKLNKKRRPAAQSCKRQASSAKLQAPSATKRTQLNNTMRLESMKKKEKIKCAWCDSELIETEQQALKKESQHICYNCCQSDDEYYNTNKHLKK